MTLKKKNTIYSNIPFPSVDHTVTMTASMIYRLKGYGCSSMTNQFHQIIKAKKEAEENRTKNKKKP